MHTILQIAGIHSVAFKIGLVRVKAVNCGDKPSKEVITTT